MARLHNGAKVDYLKAISVYAIIDMLEETWGGIEYKAYLYLYHKANNSDIECTPEVLTYLQSLGLTDDSGKFVDEDIRDIILSTLPCGLMGYPVNPVVEILPERPCL